MSSRTNAVSSRRSRAGWRRRDCDGRGRREDRHDICGAVLPVDVGVLRPSLGVTAIRGGRRRFSGPRERPGGLPREPIAGAKPSLSSLRNSGQLRQPSARGGGPDDQDAPGNVRRARRCGAKTRAGTPCRCREDMMTNQRVVLDEVERVSARSHRRPSACDQQYWSKAVGLAGHVLSYCGLTSHLS
jgi:hypothetical protein